MAKNILIIGAVALVLGVLFLGLKNGAPTLSPHSSGPGVMSSQPQVGLNDRVPLVHLPALPYSKNKNDVGFTLPLGSGVPPPQPTPLYTAPEVATQIQHNLQDLQHALLPAPVLPPKPAELLFLPSIDPGTLNVTPTGAKNFFDYYIAVMSNPGMTRLPRVLYDSLDKDAAKRVLLPEEMIDKALAQNSFHDEHVSLAAFRQIAASFKSAAEKAPVASASMSGVEDLQHLIGLPVLLIDKAFAYESGKVSKADFLDFYTKYKTTAAVLQTTMFDTVLIARGDNGHNEVGGAVATAFSKIINILGVMPRAFAQTGIIPPEGGIIQNVDNEKCDCSGAREVDINDVSIGGRSGYIRLILYIAQEGTVVKREHDVRQGNENLGLYNSAMTTCQHYVYPDCETQNLDGTVVLMGTSGNGGGGGGGGGGDPER